MVHCEKTEFLQCVSLNWASKLAVLFKGIGGGGREPLREVTGLHNEGLHYVLSFSVTRTSSGQFH